MHIEEVDRMCVNVFTADGKPGSSGSSPRRPAGMARAQPMGSGSRAAAGCI